MQCPVPVHRTDRVLLAHGGGGRLTQELIERLFLPAFANPALAARHDGAVFEAQGGPLAFTTDAFVVDPLVFPGGTIGDLAVNGTVNDLAMCGARPVALSAAFILEEGLPMETLERVVGSMRDAALRAGVPVATGDTKVVDRGKADGMFITTSGVGVVEYPVSPAMVRPGDRILVSGPLGAHGVAILSVREGIEFETAIASDTAPLWDAVRGLCESGAEVHCLRDLTRGGLASALNEIAAAAGVGMEIGEAAIPVEAPVRAACELLGLDPLYVANEGRFAAFVSGASADRALEALRAAGCEEATIAGEVVESPAGTVILRSRIGGRRVVDMLSGEQLPRIC
ncbi:MAG: hydrogenase expression/formation protein HypE [Bryobacterales bacterium]|nr:hydrogenase expression/formation protein HypE [Bryobacterales bacterium]